MIKHWKESDAYGVLKTNVPNFAKNGLRDAIRLVAKRFCLVEDGHFPLPTFVPDGTRIEVRPANHTFQECDIVIQLFEIESTNPVSREKMMQVERLGMELFDSMDVLLELWVFNKYGEQPKLIYESKNDNWH